MAEQEKMVTNMSIRGAVDAVTEILGDNGAKILFRSAGFPNLYENPPDYTWNPCITVPEQAKIYAEIAHLVGLNGALTLWRRMGYTGVKYAVEIGHVMDAFKDMDFGHERYKAGLNIFCAAAGKGHMVEREDGYIDFDCPDCLLCKEYTESRPICTVYEGVLQYILDWGYGTGSYMARETKCLAKGDDTCYFSVVKK
jgi:predicted hydrocarbon binding protein